ncbi:MAG: hypothetical protein LBF66_02230 [Holosporales bacterium]|jgi:hypothetical protein|nr:hypothetical protein [Holosporales bacterium]
MSKFCCLVVLCAHISSAGVCADSLDEQLREKESAQTSASDSLPNRQDQLVERQTWLERPMSGFNRTSLEDSRLRDRLNGVYISLNPQVFRVMNLNGITPNYLVTQSIVATRGTRVYGGELSCIFQGIPPGEVYRDIHDFTPIDFGLGSAGNEEQFCIFNILEHARRDFRLETVNIPDLQEYAPLGSLVIPATRLQEILDDRLGYEIPLPQYHAAPLIEAHPFPPLDPVVGISRFYSFRLMCAGFWSSVKRCCCCGTFDPDDLLDQTLLP